MAPEDIIRLSIEQLEGNFSIRTLYDVLGARGISRDYLIDLASDYEGEIIELDGALYELQPGRGRIPRQWELVDEDGGAVPENGDNTKQNTNEEAS